MRVMQTLADATNVIAEGEVLQLLNCNDADVDAENYMRVIHYKTAKLFEAAMRLGAILAKASDADEAAAAKYGMHLGTAFQLIDDVLDYRPMNRKRASILAMIFRGKTYLAADLCHAAWHARANRVVREAIEQGRCGQVC